MIGPGSDKNVNFGTRFIRNKQLLQKCQPLVHSALGRAAYQLQRIVAYTTLLIFLVGMANFLVFIFASISGGQQQGQILGRPLLCPISGNFSLWCFRSVVIPPSVAEHVTNTLIGVMCHVVIALRELHSYTYKELSSSIFQSLSVSQSVSPDLHFVQYIKASMPSTDPVTLPITNQYHLILTQYHQVPTIALLY